jgi:hypothetical protein
MQPVSRQRSGKHVPAETKTRAAIEERCFLLGQPRVYIARTPGRQNQLSVGSQPVERRLGGWCEVAAAWDLAEGWQFSGVLYGRL